MTQKTVARMKRFWLMLGLMFMFNLCKAQALEFESVVLGGNSLAIIMQGNIITGDFTSFVDWRSRQPALVISLLVINSAGGDLLEAEKFAGFIANTKMPVEVAGVCASACFLMFAASPEKYAFENPKIGVHSASSNDGENPYTMMATVGAARDAQFYGVPSQIIGKMVSTRPGEMAWLNEVELLSMGTKLIPASIPTPTSAPAPAPAPVPAPAQAVGVAPSDEFQHLQQSSAFQAGRAQRQAWENWFNSLSGDAWDGAMFWAGQRSQVRPKSCYSMPYQPSPAWTFGCVTAQGKLAPSDVRRKQEPDFKAGWNSN